MARAPRPDLALLQQQAEEAIANAKPGMAIPIDTGGYSLLEVLPRPLPLPKMCATCRAWQPKHMTPSFGDCQLSRSGGPAPIITTDRTSCGAWSPK